MEFLVIAYSALAFCVFSIVFSRFGRISDDKQKRIEKISGGMQDARYREERQSFSDRVIKPRLDKMRKIMNSRTPKKKAQAENDKQNAVEKQLRLAGMFIDISDYNFRKTMFMIGGIVIGVIFLLVIPDPAYGALALGVFAIIGIAGPSFYVKSKVKSHQGGIKRQLPDAMDMLSVCIEAGLSFDASLLKVSEKLKGPFIDELMIVYREIQMGRTRKDALQNLANVTSIEELKTFLSALVQAESLGIPINNIMQAQSEQLRNTRKQEAKEKGMKASIKMIIPMLIFIFPVVFIIILGPTVLNIMNNFS